MTGALLSNFEKESDWLLKVAMFPMNQLLSVLAGATLDCR